jgi:hypothetical protein
MPQRIWTAQEANRSWQDAITYYEHSVIQDGFVSHRPLLEFTRRISVKAYSPDILTWIGMGVLSFAPRHCPGELNCCGSASIRVTNRGLLEFEITHSPSGRILLRRECEPIEAERVFASVLLRLKFDQDLIG